MLTALQTVVVLYKPCYAYMMFCKYDMVRRSQTEVVASSAIWGSAEKQTTSRIGGIDWADAISIAKCAV